MNGYKICISGPLVTASKISEVAWVFVGVFVLSQFPISFFRSILGTPLNPIEVPAILIGIILMRYDYRFVNRLKATLKIDWMWILLSIISLLFLLTVIKRTDEVGSAYSDLRAHIALIFFAFLFSGYWVDENYRARCAALISFGCILGDLLQIFVWGIDVTAAKIPLAIMPAAFLLVYGLARKTIAGSMFGMGSICLFAILGGFRLYYAVFAFSVFLLLYVATFGRGVTGKAGRKIAILVVAVTALSIILLKDVIFDYWTSSITRQIHSVNRALETSDAGLDQQRSGSYWYPFLNPEDFLIPKGLGVWAYYKDFKNSEMHSIGNIESSADSMFFYSVFHHGIFLASLLVLCFLGVSVFRLVVSKNMNRAHSIYLVGCMGVQGFVESGPFFMIQRAVPWALFLAFVIVPIDRKRLFPKPPKGRC